MLSEPDPRARHSPGARATNVLRADATRGATILSSYKRLPLSGGELSLSAPSSPGQSTLSTAGATRARTAVLREHASTPFRGSPFNSIGVLGP